MKLMQERVALVILVGAMGAATAARAQTGGMTMTNPRTQASQQGQAGDSVISPDIGFGAPVSELNLSRIGAGSQRPGDPALSVGARYLYQTSPRVSFGGEVSHTTFGDRDFVEPGLAGTIGGSLLTIEGLAKYMFTPQRAVSPYAIGGLGLDHFAAHVRETRDPADVLLDNDSVGLAASAGGGVEGRFGKEKNLVTGAEVRWQLATIDSGKFGSSVVNAMGLSGRVGYKF